MLSSGSTGCPTVLPRDSSTRWSATRSSICRATLPAVQNRARPSSAGSPLTQWQPWTSSAGSARSTRSWRSLAAARRGSGPSSPSPFQSRSNCSWRTAPRCRTAAQPLRATVPGSGDLLRPVGSAEPDRGTGDPMVAARNCTHCSCFIGREGVLEFRRSCIRRGARRYYGEFRFRQRYAVEQERQRRC